MAAPKGNEYYLLRSKNGKNKVYNTIQLAEKANEYFNYCLDNPLQEMVIFHHQGTTTKDFVDKMRPFTIQGMCNYLDICEKTFNNYSNDKDYLQVTIRIRQIIYNQKFEGAASGFLNPNIIARDLGLTDKQQTDINLPESNIVVQDKKTAANLKKLQDDFEND